MPTYAAIPVDRNTVMELFAHVADVPDGQSRLAWALFRFPYREGEEYYFIGGNYLGISGPPDFSLQIISKAQLDSGFDYNPKHVVKGSRPRKNGSWFAVKVKEGVIFRGPRSKATMIEEELAG